MNGGSTSYTVDDWLTPLAPFDRCVSAGWVVRVETDGRGKLVEVRERPAARGVYGSEPAAWHKLRADALRPKPIHQGNLVRSAARMGRQVRMLELMADTGGRGLRAGKLSRLIGTSPRHAGNLLRDLQGRGYVEHHAIVEPTDAAPFRRTVHWTVTDDWPKFLAYALLRLLATEEMTAKRAARLMDLHYEQVVKALEHLYADGRACRAWSIEGYVYRPADEIVYDGKST